MKCYIKIIILNLKNILNFRKSPIFYIGDFLWYKISKMEKNTI